MALITLDEYKNLSPRNQGYVIYMQAEHDGSELRLHQENPYPKESIEAAEWDKGQQLAVISVTDLEE